MKVHHRVNLAVPRIASGPGSLSSLGTLLESLGKSSSSEVIFLADSYMIRNKAKHGLETFFAESSILIEVPANEPTTTYLDSLRSEVLGRVKDVSNCLVVGVGGGVTLDSAKALSVLMTNDLPAMEYQGWDIPTRRAIPKIGIPTISGTGAESSRTAVLTNPVSGLKLGINSDFSMFDALVLDANLTATVPLHLYFYNGLDAYMHSFEILTGSYRNPLSDSLAEAALSLCEQVFQSPEPQSIGNRTKLMSASYLAGQALTSSYVGAVHPVSAAIGVLYAIPHGVANIIALNMLRTVYPNQYAFVGSVLKQNRIPMPSIDNFSEEVDFGRVVELASRHSLPLENALGEAWSQTLTEDFFHGNIREN